MATTKICSTSYGNLGSLCDKGSGMTAITGMILTTDTFKFDAYTDFADETKYQDAIKAKQIFPLMDVLEYDDNTEETPYYESPLGVKIKLRNGKYIYTFRFNLNDTQHKELQKFSSANLRYFLVDSNGVIYGYSDDGVTVQGYSISTFEAEKQQRASADTPAWSPVSITEKNSVQFNQFKLSIQPDWVAEDLAGLANVNLTVVSSSATEVILSVGAPTGKLNSDGSLQTIPITGILTADFTLTGGSAVFTDNVDGTYTGVGTGITAGDANLVAPSAMTSTGLLIESTGAVPYTV
jgi:hypothetical protein